jgi:tetratricopeptide (TPR) repeat protein
MTPNSGYATRGQGAEVQVRLVWANDREVSDNSVHVQLLNSTNIPVQDTFADRDGNVWFHAVTPGSYHLKLDGPNIEDQTTDRFDIGYQERMHSEWVHLTPKKTAAENGIGQGPMVSATELNCPPKARAEMEKGMEAFTKGDLKKAEERLRKAIEIYPKYARAWNNLGVVLMKANNEAGAREAWQKAIEADDKFASSYLNLARLAMREKKTAEAEAYIAKALAPDPNNPEALTLLAREELATQQYDKAISNAHRVHAVPHEHYPEVHLIAGEALLDENKGDEAFKEFDLYLKEDPDSPNAAQVRTAMAQIQAKETAAKTN